MNLIKLIYPISFNNDQSDAECTEGWIRAKFKYSSILQVYICFNYSQEKVNQKINGISFNKTLWNKTVSSRFFFFFWQLKRGGVQAVNKI